MAKNIPTNEFKAAIKEFNKVLKSVEKKTIKFVGIKKETVLEEFTKHVLNFIENNKASDLPDIVIDFYNTHIVQDENSTEDKKEKKKEKKEKKKEKKEKKEKKAKTPGVVALAVDAYMKKGIITTKDITAHLADKFPGRNISSTVSNVVCVLKHVDK